LKNNKLINPKLICAFCWVVLFFNCENARSKNQKKKSTVVQLNTAFGLLQLTVYILGTMTVVDRFTVRYGILL